MKTKFSKKVIAFLLALMCLITSVPFTAVAESVNGSGVDVEIVSFMRGKQDNLRASELLEARVTGYEGNVENLTYEWTNSLGTYLYVYNSHNMYYINNTDGEIEIYNQNISSSTNMAGRSFKDSYKKQGFCWAAVYGSFTSGTGKSINSTTAFVGTITVKVYDGNTLLAEDTHEGKRVWVSSGRWGSYQQQGIVDSDLSSDMDDVTIGIFEGDKRNVKDLLGESAILHITCSESNVQSGRVTMGTNNITLTGNATDDYYITAKPLEGEGSTSAEGDAQVELTIKKNNCKFHAKTTATAITTVYVFKKPITSTTAYTLTLTDNIDKRCEYFINGNKGVVQTDGTILFEGLTPNTKYMVEVRAKYMVENDTRYTYAYVYDTTKPIYNGTVEVYLNGTYNSATHTATGTKVNLEDVTPYSTVFVKDTKSARFIQLDKKKDSTGTYTSILDDGSYNLYYTTDVSTKIDDQIMVMNQADRTRYLFYNSVEYKDGETPLGDTEYYVLGSSVTTRPALTKAGYVFVGWKDANGNVYPANGSLTNSISNPYVLEAVWEKGVDVTVNIVLDHTGENDGVDIDTDSKFNVSFDLMHRVKGTTSDFTDVLAPVAVYNKGTLSSDYEVTKTENDEGVVTKTVYTAKSPNLEDVAKGMEYSIEVAKSSYELTSVETEYDAEGNVTLTATLKFSPKNTDLVFDVELDQSSKMLIKEHPQYKPKAANVKVLYWNDEYKEWHHITQHENTFVTVYLDENGEGTGKYPVWNYNNTNEPYYYRIKVVSYVLEDGTVIEANDVENYKDVQYVTADERYRATIVVGNEGKNPEQGSTLTGSYFDDNVQKGSLLAEINIETFNVTFEPDGGKFSDGTTTDKTETNQVAVPELAPFTPVKDGGYVFDGWYLVDKNGNITEETVNSGDALFENITLRAKWKEPLTVEGSISVAGYYYLDNDKNEVRIIHEADRTHAVTVLLQKILPNGYAETIDSQLVRVSYSDIALIDDTNPMGYAKYTFTALPDDSTVYRILVANPNYTVAYQNEPESVDDNKISNYSLYNANDFMADFGDTEPLVADVNALLVFTPTNFKLVYEVIASSIGEGFRPSNAEILVLYNDLKSGVNPQGWPVISQMITGEKLKGNETAIDADGKGKDSEPVWILMPDGKTLYDYSVLLKNYTINGKETQFDAVNAPFFVYYNGDARYSAREDLNPEHQTQLLTVTLAPKRYIVNFDMNFTETYSDYVSDFKFTVTPKVEHGTDENGQPVIVYNETPVHETSHIWSYETDLSDAIPTRQGYKFLGWYDEQGNRVTKIGAEVAKDVTLKAKWEELFKVTFHANNEDIAEDVFRVYYEKGNAPENALCLNDNNTISSFYEIPEFDYETHNKYIFKGWYLKDGTPINWDDVYTGDTDIYAHWIESGEVQKDPGDKKNIGNDVYKGYDLIGVQIRDVKADSQEHYGEAGTGLRFVTVMSESVYDQIKSITDANKNGAEYGFVVAKKDTIAHYAQGENYTLQYKAENVNGVDTTKDYSYVQNIKCSGVIDHMNFTDYRLYTAVITYDTVAPEALESAHQSMISARAYVRYTDANGLLRTYYNNYTGNVRDYSACSASFNLAKGLMNQ